MERSGRFCPSHRWTLYRPERAEKSKRKSLRFMHKARLTRTARVIVAVRMRPRPALRGPATARSRKERRADMKRRPRRREGARYMGPCGKRRTIRTAIAWSGVLTMPRPTRISCPRRLAFGPAGLSGFREAISPKSVTRVEIGIHMISFRYRNRVNCVETCVTSGRRGWRVAFRRRAPHAKRSTGEFHAASHIAVPVPRMTLCGISAGALRPWIPDATGTARSDRPPVDRNTRSEW